MKGYSPKLISTTRRVFGSFLRLHFLSRSKVKVVARHQVWEQNISISHKLLNGYLPNFVPRYRAMRYRFRFIHICIRSKVKVTKVRHVWNNSNLYISWTNGQNFMGFSSLHSLNIYLCFLCILPEPDVIAQTAAPSILEHMTCAKLGTYLNGLPSCFT